MKTKIMICSIVLLLSAFTGSVYGGFEGFSNTFYGNGAGLDTTGDDDYDTFIGNGAGGDNTTGYCNTFVGHWAGRLNTTGHNNTFLGENSGWHNTTGNYNTFVGRNAGGLNLTGSENTSLGYYAGFNNNSNGNVFLGYQAGYNETGSDKLYIANSNTTAPLIYGEFDNRILTINGNLEIVAPDNGLIYLTNVTTDNTTKVSRMVLNHYINDDQLPVYLFGAAATATNNYVAFGGGGPIGNAATQIDLYTASNTITPTGTPRLTIIKSGNVGIGTQTPSYPLHMASGAYVSVGGMWMDASSREFKDNVKGLKVKDAIEALQGLNPVTFNYKVSPEENHVGFVAEEVPDLVATKDRKGLSPMDIVAVLTKVVQEQQKIISFLREEVNELKEKENTKER